MNNMVRSRRSLDLMHALSRRASIDYVRSIHEFAAEYYSAEETLLPDATALRFESRTTQQVVETFLQRLDVTRDHLAELRRTTRRELPLDARVPPGDPSDLEGPSSLFRAILPETTAQWMASPEIRMANSEATVPGPHLTFDPSHTASLGRARRFDQEIINMATSDETRLEAEIARRPMSARYSAASQPRPRATQRPATSARTPVAGPSNTQRRATPARQAPIASSSRRPESPPAYADFDPVPQQVPQQYPPPLGPPPGPPPQGFYYSAYPPHQFASSANMPPGFYQYPPPAPPSGAPAPSQVMPPPETPATVPQPAPPITPISPVAPAPTPVALPVVNENSQGEQQDTGGGVSGGSA